jgi:hypothetical protein
LTSKKNKCYTFEDLFASGFPVVSEKEVKSHRNDQIWKGHQIDDAGIDPFSYLLTT